MRAIAHDERSVTVFAISTDSMATLRAWGDAKGVSFPLLSDFWPHGDVSRAFDAFDDEVGHPTRVSYLIDRGGVIRESFVSAPGETRPLADYRRAMAALDQ